MMCSLISIYWCLPAFNSSSDQIGASLLKAYHLSAGLWGRGERYHRRLSHSWLRTWAQVATEAEMFYVHMWLFICM